MDKKEAIDILNDERIAIWTEPEEEEIARKQNEAIDMAIEALQEPIYCNECKHQDYCYQTVSYTKVRLGYNEYGAKPIEWCSRAERREP